MMFMNKEQDIVDCLSFFENLKMLTQRRIDQNVFTVVYAGFTTEDHRKEMKRQATIKKQSLRDHRSLLTTMAKNA